MGGFTILAVIFAPVALIIGLNFFYDLRVKYLPCSKPSGIFIMLDVHPSGAVLRRNTYWRLESYWAYGGGCRVVRYRAV